MMAVTLKNRQHIFIFLKQIETWLKVVNVKGFNYIQTYFIIRCTYKDTGFLMAADCCVGVFSYVASFVYYRNHSRVGGNDIDNYIADLKFGFH